MPSITLLMFLIVVGIILHLVRRPERTQSKSEYDHTNAERSVRAAALRDWIAEVFNGRWIA